MCLRNALRRPWRFAYRGYLRSGVPDQGMLLMSACKSSSRFGHAFHRRQRCASLPAARQALAMGRARAHDKNHWLCFIDDDCLLAGDFITQLARSVARYPTVTGWGPVIEGRSRQRQRWHRLAQLGAQR